MQNQTIGPGSPWFISRGFTLLEVLIAMAIVVIGITLAFPSYKQAIERRQLSAGVEEVSALLSFAQSEAIKRGEEAELRAETRIFFRLEEPLVITEKL